MASANQRLTFAIGIRNVIPAALEQLTVATEHVPIGNTMHHVEGS